MSETNSILKGSRRTFLQLSAAATAAMAFRISTEATLAAEDRNVMHPGAVVIDANENPLGPCDAARKAIVDMAPQGGRYSYWLKEEFVKTFHGNGRTEAGIRSRVSRLQRAAAFFRLVVHFADAQLCHR